MPGEKGRKEYLLQVKDLYSENRTAAEVFGELILAECKLSTAGDGGNHLES